MPDGYELLVGQWRNGTVNGTIQYLTTRRFRSACVNGNCSANADAALPLMMALWGYTGIMRADDYRPKLVQSGYVPFPAYQIGMIYSQATACLNLAWLCGFFFEHSLAPIIIA